MDCRWTAAQSNTVELPCSPVPGTRVVAGRGRLRRGLEIPGCAESVGEARLPASLPDRYRGSDPSVAAAIFLTRLMLPIGLEPMTFGSGGR